MGNEKRASLMTQLVGIQEVRVTNRERIFNATLVNIVTLSNGLELTSERIGRVSANEGKMHFCRC